MPSKKLRSLAWLASQSDPFEHLSSLTKRLGEAAIEGRHIEWKSTCPIGPNVSKRTKYRTVRALISFANTAGGFVVCGVDNNGKWRGLEKEDMTHVDPAKLSELISGVIAPDLPQLSYREIEVRGKLYIVLHAPPSEEMPHVTTKDVREKMPDGSFRTLIANKAVYSRFGGKSDLAAPACYQRIVARRTEFLKEDLLRTIKKVPVPVPVAKRSGQGSGTGTMLRVSRITDDPTAPAVRLTHKKGEVSGIFLHEELSDGLFDEINNVVEANRLLAKGQNRFFLGLPLYYRVYAERQHIVGDEELFETLAGAGLHEFYAPALFWLLNLPPEVCARLLSDLCLEPKAPHIHTFMRIACLFGREFSEWLAERWNERWKAVPQPPDYHWTYKKMLNRRDTNVLTLIALRSKSDTKFKYPGIASPPTYGELLESPSQAAKLLSEACMKEFENDQRYRSFARPLDCLAYGPALSVRADEIAPLVIEMVDEHNR